MAIIKSAKKAIRSSARKRVFNIRTKSTLHDTVKKYRKLVASKSVKEAEAMIPKVYEALDKAAKRGVIKKNTATRMKSRLVQALKKVAK